MILLLVGLFAIFVSGLRIAREYQRAVVFRLGRYNALRGPGLFWLIPLGIENETRIDLRIVTNPIEQQETITRDSVTVKVNAVLWFRVGDPKKAVLMVENFRSAVQQVDADLGRRVGPEYVAHTRAALAALIEASRDTEASREAGHG